MRENANEIIHYNEIPDFVFTGGGILDIGSNDGYGAYHSRHRERFLTSDYLGVDVGVFDFTYLEPIIRSDFLKFETDKAFDTIIFSHLLEHFDIGRWPEIFDRLRGLLSDTGFLVVNVPYKEETHTVHSVLHIDEALLLRFCPFQNFIKCYEHNHDRVKFRDSKENIIKALVRFAYRIVTNHKYSIVRTFKKKHVRLVAVYQKEIEEE